MKNDRINPFRIDVAPELLSELQERLKNTRWSYRVEGTNWDAGDGSQLPQGTGRLLAGQL